MTRPTKRKRYARLILLSFITTTDDTAATFKKLEYFLLVMKKSLVIITLLLLVTACKEDLPPTPPSPGETTPVGSPSLVNVVIENFAFSPTVVTIKAGDQVRWTNKDSVIHTATGENFDTGSLKEGESKVVTFDTPGEYAYICTPHPNMKGKVVVN